MTRVELFNALCDVADALQGIARALQEAESPQQYALEVQVQRLDERIDDILKLVDVPGDEPTPCPHCGQARCEVGARGEEVGG